MRDEERNKCFTIQNEKYEEVEPAVSQKPPELSVEEGPPAPAPMPTRAAQFLSVLSSVEASQKDWPQEALKATLGRFGRVPRLGWKKATDFFCKKFSVDVSVEEFKSLAQKLLISSGGRRCSQKDFSIEAHKRYKTAMSVFDENTMLMAKLHIKVRNVFRRKLKEAQGRDIEDAERTPKVPSDRIDLNVLEALNGVVGEHITENSPCNMEDATRILQAVQAAYKECTAKERKPSSWVASIEKRITVLAAKKALLEKQRRKEVLSKNETRLIRQVMSGQKLDLKKPRDVDAAIVNLDDLILAHKKRLEMHERRKEFHRDNRCFELYRGRFYKQLSSSECSDDNVPVEEIRRFWSTMWTKPDLINDTNYQGILLDFEPGPGEATHFPSRTEFGTIVMRLPNWKAAGVDGVFNFFIKRISSLHDCLYSIVRSICLEGAEENKWFYRGLTYLIPKGTPSVGSDYRPITCMSNLYKLVTKCVTETFQLEVERRGLLTENQMGTVRRVQGAKEQALLNLAVNKEHGNELKAMWIDVRKAFDSVDHCYLRECVARLNLPAWITNFLNRIISQWSLTIMAKGEVVLEKKVERGILQGDSLSPLLFVLCMDPLSRRLNGMYPKVSVPTSRGDDYVTNHLLFIDDLKLLSLEEDNLKKMSREVVSFFRTVGLEMNYDKSATNVESCKDTATLLEGIQGYKYLGIIEDPSGVPKRESFEKVREELLARVERLCERKLNAHNLFHAINEHAISLVNYYVGVWRVGAEEFEELDHAVRKVLLKHHVHYQPASKARLYLPRAELGRGLHSIAHRSECVLLQLYDTLELNSVVSTRRSAILAVEQRAKTHLALIRSYIALRYNVPDKSQITRDSLIAAQRAALYSEISSKTLHKKLYSSADNEQVSMKDSSLWLRRGNIAPRDEAAFCHL